MSNLFANVKKYAGKWEVVSVETLDDADLAELESTAMIVKSTYGKSFRFTTRIGKYQMFIPADDAVEEPIGSLVKLTRLRVVVLHKAGEEDIQRIRVEAE